jgi:hypothetical protein
MTASLYEEVLRMSSQNSLLFAVANLAVAAGMSQILRIELSVKRLGIGTRSRRTDDFTQIST